MQAECPKLFKRDMVEVLSPSRGHFCKLQKQNIASTNIENKTPLNINHSISKAHMSLEQKEKEEIIIVLLFDPSQVSF